MTQVVEPARSALLRGSGTWTQGAQAVKGQDVRRMLNDADVYATAARRIAEGAPLIEYDARDVLGLRD